MGATESLQGPDFALFFIQFKDLDKIFYTNKSLWFTENTFHLSSFSLRKLRQKPPRLTYKLGGKWRAQFRQLDSFSSC